MSTVFTIITIWTILPMIILGPRHYTTADRMKIYWSYLQPCYIPHLWNFSHYIFVLKENLQISIHVKTWHDKKATLSITAVYNHLFGIETGLVF